VAIFLLFRDGSARRAIEREGAQALSCWWNISVVASY